MLVTWNNEPKKDFKDLYSLFQWFSKIRLENCFYALDAYEARTLAMEFNEFINAHPNSIDLIRCER